MEIKSTKDVSSHKIKMLVYGQAGAGKTYLASTAPDPVLVISAESGLLSLSQHDVDYVTVKTVNDVLEVYQFLAKNEDGGKYQWVCLDSISEIAEVILVSEKKKEKDPRKAYGTMLDRMTSLTRHFRDLDRNVYVSAKMEKVKDEVSGCVLYSPATPGNKLAASLPYFFDEVFALRVIENEAGETKRYLQTACDVQYLAKDRSGRLDQYEEPNITKIYNKILGLDAEGGEPESETTGE